jgi:hypothetical protein
MSFPLVSYFLRSDNEKNALVVQRQLKTPEMHSSLSIQMDDEQRAGDAVSHSDSLVVLGNDVGSMFGAELPSRYCTSAP